MKSSNTNHEDKGNEGSINISLATSSLERKMLEHIATQTQVLQAMAQTMVKIHQSITEQALLTKDHNTVTNDNHQNMTLHHLIKRSYQLCRLKSYKEGCSLAQPTFIMRWPKTEFPLGQ
jgi:hypothetical protein